MAARERERSVGWRAADARAIEQAHCDGVARAARHNGERHCRPRARAVVWPRGETVDDLVQETIAAHHAHDVLLSALLAARPALHAERPRDLESVTRVRRLHEARPHACTREQRRDSATVRAQRPTGAARRVDEDEHGPRARCRQPCVHFGGPVLCIGRAAEDHAQRAVASPPAAKRIRMHAHHPPSRLGADDVGELALAAATRTRTILGRERAHAQITHAHEAHAAARAADGGSGDIGRAHRLAVRDKCCCQGGGGYRRAVRGAHPPGSPPRRAPRAACGAAGCAAQAKHNSAHSHGGVRALGRVGGRARLRAAHHSVRVGEGPSGALMCAAELARAGGELVPRCFLATHFYSRALGRHVDYSGAAAFEAAHAAELARLPPGEASTAVQELEAERARRANLGVDRRRREALYRAAYRPAVPAAYELRADALAPELARAANAVRAAPPAVRRRAALAQLAECAPRHSAGPLAAKGVYHLPVLSAVGCERLVRELANFRASGLERARPNSMNENGVLLGELGFGARLLDPLLATYVQPLAGALFAECGGATLDHHRSFTVEYEAGGEESLAYHFDDSEVTLNVCLSGDSEYEGGELLFGADKSEGDAAHERRWPLRHKQGWGVLHRG